MGFILPHGKFIKTQTISAITNYHPIQVFSTRLLMPQTISYPMVPTKCAMSSAE